MAYSSGELEFWLLAGCGFGVFTFFRGFRIYREYRLLEDTPEVPVGSVAMGLVRAHGKALGEHQVLSPLARTPRFFYQVVVDFTESCIEPGHWYDVTGTCGENPRPKDEDDRN